MNPELFHFCLLMIVGSFSIALVCVCSGTNAVPGQSGSSPIQVELNRRDYRKRTFRIAIVAAGTLASMLVLVRHFPTSPTSGPAGFSIAVTDPPHTSTGNPAAIPPGGSATQRKDTPSTPDHTSAKRPAATSSSSPFSATHLGIQLSEAVLAIFAVTLITSSVGKKAPDQPQTLKWIAACISVFGFLLFAVSLLKQFHGLMEIVIVVLLASVLAALTSPKCIKTIAPRESAKENLLFSSVISATLATAVFVFRSDMNPHEKSLELVLNGWEIVLFTCSIVFTLERNAPSNC